jgi:hypothetical protein
MVVREQWAALPGLEDQVGADRHYLGTRGEAVQHQTLQIFDLAGGDVDEVVVGSRHVVQGARVWLGEHVSHEWVDEGPVVRADADREERLQREPGYR